MRPPVALGVEASRKSGTCSTCGARGKRWTSGCAARPPRGSGRPPAQGAQALLAEGRRRTR
eukprot:10699211-Alexandrium_andersonii.AAC.1